MMRRSLKPAGEADKARWVALGWILAGTVLVSGCATKQNPDPLESWNRQVFSFNDGLDRKVMKPVAQAYKAVTPDFFRQGVDNFFGNFRDILTTTNLFLQGRFADGTLGVMRVSVNTTLGLGGLLDVATPMRLYKTNEDFGQTLGVWGVKSGAYIVWPVLGSSTLRDSVGMPGDLYFSPTTLSRNARVDNQLRLSQLVNTRAGYLDATSLLDDVALDQYAFVRDAYLQRRQNLIYNGDPPEDTDDSEQDAVPPADPAAKP